MFLLGDLTRANPGTIQSVIKRVPSLEGHHSLAVLIHPDQLPEMVDSPSIVVHEIARDGDISARILSLIDEQVKLGTTQLCVLSFNSFVLDLWRRIEPSEGRQVSFKPWGRAFEIGISSSSESSVQNKSPQVWPLSSIGEVDAVTVLSNVLAKRNATSRATALLKTQLRELIAKEEPLLSKASTTAVPGLISKLIDAAERGGVVAVDRTNMNHAVWKQVAEVPGSIPTAEPKRVVPKDEQYRAALKAARMGPFPNFRDDLFLEIQNLTSTCQGLTAGMLIPKAVSSVQAKNAAHKDFSWGPVQSFLTTLFKRCAVLDAGDGVFKLSFENAPKTVQKLADNWQRQFDGELIICILEGGCELSYYDVAVLTGTLYPTRDSDYQNRLLEALQFLKLSNRIRYTEDDSIVLAGA